jgi:hypothetical protein
MMTFSSGHSVAWPVASSLGSSEKKRGAARKRTVLVRHFFGGMPGAKDSGSNDEGCPSLKRSISGGGTV